MWSFGVMMWEVASMGKLPWYELDNWSQVQACIMGGGVMACPEGCTPELYGVMKRCWTPGSRVRPEIGAIRGALRAIQENSEA